MNEGRSRTELAEAVAFFDAAQKGKRVMKRTMTDESATLVAIRW